MSRTSIKIKTLFTEYEGQMGQEITVKGWIRNHRRQKNMGFIELYDGSWTGSWIVCAMVPV